MAIVKSGLVVRKAFYFTLHLCMTGPKTLWEERLVDVRSPFLHRAMKILPVPWVLGVVERNLCTCQRQRPSHHSWIASQISWHAVCPPHEWEEPPSDKLCNSLIAPGTTSWVTSTWMWHYAADILLIWSTCQTRNEFSFFGFCLQMKSSRLWSQPETWCGDSVPCISRAVNTCVCIIFVAISIMFVWSFCTTCMCDNKHHCSTCSGIPR